jgi:hypothetical protein
MKTSEENAKLVISCVNNIISKEIDSFSKIELTKILKETKCPYSSSIFNLLKSCELITNISRGKYIFTTTQPIYYGIIQKELDKAMKMQQVYNHNSKK